MPKNIYLRIFLVKFWPYVLLVFKSGLYSRVGYDGVRTVLQSMPAKLPGKFSPFGQIFQHGSDPPTENEL